MVLVIWVVTLFTQVDILVCCHVREICCLNLPPKQNTLFTLTAKVAFSRNVA
jgi:hypothetical protein